MCELDRARKWEVIATGLRLPQGTINEIKTSNDSNNELRLSAVLHAWKEQKTIPFTLDSIVRVMEGPIVKDKEAADKLKEKIINSKVQPIQDSYQPRTVPKGKLIVSTITCHKCDRRSNTCC